MLSARDAVVSAARSVIGCTAPSPEYASLVAPDDTPERRAQVMTESGCGLVVLGIQERALCVPPRGPYRDGSAFTLVYARAGGSPWQPGGACRVPGLEEPPQPGDAIVWGPAGSAVAHMETVVDARADGATLALDVVAGGQRDAHGGQTVTQLSRTARWDGRRWVDSKTGRPLLAVIDADALGERYPALPSAAAEAVA